MDKEQLLENYKAVKEKVEKLLKLPDWLKENNTTTKMGAYNSRKMIAM